MVRGPCFTVLRALMVLAALSGLPASCAKPHPKVSSVELQPIRLPKNVVSIAGEVRAFVAVGKGGSSKANVSLADLMKRFGSFKTGRAMAFDSTGRMVSLVEIAVAPDSTASLDATVGQRYLIYPDLNERMRPTYGVLCKLSKLRVSGGAMAKICQQILCTNEPFQAADLGKLVPEIGPHAKELGNDVIGGLPDGPRPGGPMGGSICDQCIGQDFVYPELECNDVVIPSGQLACGEGDRVVFVHRLGTLSKLQLLDGTGVLLNDLTAGDFNDGAPDVSLHDERVLFVRSSAQQSSLFTVNLDGSSLAEIPGTAGAAAPCWGRGENFIAFALPVAGSTQTAIFRIGPGGATTPVQVTHPADGESDNQPAVLDAKHVLFVRTGSFGKELFIQDLWSGDPPTKLTELENNGVVRSPVAGHVKDDRLVAFVEEFSALQPADIRVGKLDPTFSQLTILHTIHPGAPVERLTGGLDLSSDDQCVFLDAITAGVPGTLANRIELFRVGFDGSNPYRLTTNESEDGAPTTVTQ